MGKEISVSAVLIEREDGTYRANCPELDVETEGESSEEAFENLKASVQLHVKKAGAEGLKQVKCFKFKVTLD
ncbi:MAG: type II toxin-antitoxin system HicB family antitoxin [Thermodesulfobacteriota bacterium]|nr:MAG: type II toxin-antitoxin system HicB family antitoxin [Thermodesulfobacteriota bacterium]